MYAIEQFLSNIRSYDDANNFEKFILELQKIPNYQEVFTQLLEQNPEWLELAKGTEDENGMHIFYLLAYMKTAFGEDESTQMNLMTFSGGKDPAIKVLAKRNGYKNPKDNYYL